MLLAYHAFSHFPIRSITQLDSTTWSPSGHSLENWRHILYLSGWRNGFTVDDGPLQSFAIEAAAHLGAMLRMNRSACVSHRLLEQRACISPPPCKPDRCESDQPRLNKNHAAMRKHVSDPGAGSQR